jgi:hypothetical protein
MNKLPPLKMTAKLVGKETTTTVVVVDTTINYREHIIDGRIYTNEGVITLSEAVIKQLYSQICDANEYISKQQ